MNCSSNMSSSVDKPALKKKLTAAADAALKVYLSTRRGSAIPPAMTEDDLTEDEKVGNFHIFNTTCLLGSSG